MKTWCQKCSALLSKEEFGCEDCKLVYYCSKEHQEADDIKHKYRCAAISKARANLEKEETELRNKPEDFFPLATSLKLVSAIFGKLLITNLIVYACVDQRIRDHVPSNLIRLGRDQEAYDFIKWWATCDPGGTYDWGDTSLPYLSIKNADVTEVPYKMLEGKFYLDQLVCLALIKYRLWTDGQAKLSTSGLGHALPTELNLKIQSYNSFGSDAFPKNVEGKKLKELCTDLESQLESIFNHVYQKNEHFFEYCRDLSEFIQMPRPSYYSFGSSEETILALKSTYPLLRTHRGFIKKYFEISGEDDYSEGDYEESVWFDDNYDDHEEAWTGEDDFEGDRFDEEDMNERMQNMGFTQDDLEELLAQGVMPWDDDAWAVLDALNGGHD